MDYLKRFFDRRDSLKNWKTERDILFLITSSLRNIKAIHEFEGLRVTQYDSSNTNPDNIFAKNSWYVNEVLSTYGKKLDPKFLEELKAKFVSVIFIGIVQKKETDEYEYVEEIDILDDLKFERVQSTIANNRNKFWTTLVMVRDRTE